MDNTTSLFIGAALGFIVGVQIALFRRRGNHDESQNLIINKLNQIIMTNAEILAKLEEADAQTNEIAADIADLVANSGVSAEVADRLTAHVEKLKGIASTHTPA